VGAGVSNTPQLIGRVLLGRNLLNALSMDIINSGNSLALAGMFYFLKNFLGWLNFLTEQPN
jgi:hypothetical protein